MKAALCVVLLAVGAFGADEKKNDKRDVLGLGYGLGAPAPLLGGGIYGGHGLGLYGGHGGLGLYGGHGGLGWGHGGLGWGQGLSAAPVISHGIAPAPLLGHGLGYSAPLLSHSVGYGAPLVSHAPLLGLGHGYGYGGWH